MIRSTRPASGPTRLYVAAGSCGTVAGLVAGALLADAPYRVHGVAVSGGDPEKTIRASAIVLEAAERVGTPLSVGPEDFETDHAQIGPGYGLATPACLEAIRLAARTEGILLDPVYTGKAMAGLIADIRVGEDRADRDGRLPAHRWPAGDLRPCR